LIQDTQVIVKVKGTGTPRDPDILPQLFSKFSAKSFEGTGLGLFIAKSIVEDHGRKIWAENNNTHEAKGVAFVLLFQPSIASIDNKM
jgi:signal transduction histidine kinase